MKRLSDILTASVEQKEVLRAARAQTVFKKWREAVGETLSAKTVPDRYERGTLWICATSSTWAQEIRLQQDLVLSRMNALAEEPGLFRELKVGVRPTHRDLIG